MIIDQTGIWNYCEGYYRPDLDWASFVTSCGPQTKNYYFNPIEIVATELLPLYTIVFLQQEADAIDIIRNTSNWLKAAFTISAICTGIALIMGILTGVWHERRLFNCFPVGCMCLSGLFWFGGAVSATNVYFTLRNSFNNDVELNVQAHMGHRMFSWVWLGFGTAWMALLQWCCAAVCCPGGHRKRRVAWSAHSFIPRLMPKLFRDSFQFHGQDPTWIDQVTLCLQ